MPDGNPTGLLLAKPNAGILYATLAKGPKLPFDYQLNSTRHFMRELNRLGVTGAIDAGGGFQNYPEDYAVIQKLADEGQLTIRLAYNLFTQKPKQEKDDFLNWTRIVEVQAGRRLLPPQRRRRDAGVLGRRLRGLPPAAPRHAAGDGGRARRGRAHPGRRTAGRGGMHATYDETICRALDVFERVNQDIPLDGPQLVLRPRRDHLGAVDRPHRGARRRHRRAAPHGLSGRILRRALRAGRGRSHAAGRAHAGEGRQGLRRHRRHARRLLQSLGLARLAGHRAAPSAGLRIYPQRNCLDRETALRMWTENVTWFSNEEGKKGRIEVGQLADLIVPDRDYLRLRRETRSPTPPRELTIVGGKIVYAAGAFASLDDSAPPPAMPDWSPVRTFGGYAAWGEPGAPAAGVHRHAAAATLRLRQRLRRPRPRPRHRLGEQAAGRRPQELLGRARLRLLRVLKHRTATLTTLTENS